LGRYPHTGWTGRLTTGDRNIIEESISIVGLKGYERRMINHISDGERQKAMIARTLAQDTDIIVLDEPTAFLDLSNKYEIIHLLHKLANEKAKTILFSTHDLNSAIAESDRLWLMFEKSIEEGSPEDLILNGSIKNLFHNDHLIFDNNKGEFRIRRECTNKAVVRGSGDELSWTIKMLERIGFDTVNEENHNPAEPPILIDISYPYWNLRSGNSEIKFDSLYALGRYLKSYKSLSLETSPGSR
jgi:iron complex transport system ATP-binding protein